MTDSPPSSPPSTLPPAVPSTPEAAFAGAKRLRKFDRSTQPRLRSFQSVEEAAAAVHEVTPVKRRPRREGEAERGGSSGRNALERSDVGVSLMHRSPSFAYLVRDSADSALERAFLQLECGWGVVQREDLMRYLEEQRAALNVHWSPQAYAEYLRFHVSAACSPERQQFSFEDFVLICKSLRAFDNREFFVTRLFSWECASSETGEQTEDVLRIIRELRSATRMVQRKAGEIIVDEGADIRCIHILYSGVASCFRSVRGGVQNIIELSAGHIYGLVELILGLNSSLLSLKMAEDGCVLTFPYEKFRQLVRHDEAFLWNIVHGTLSSVARIRHFIRAAPFLCESAAPPQREEGLATVVPRREPPITEVAAKGEQDDANTNAAVSFATPTEALEALFGVNTERWGLDAAHTEEHFRFIVLGKDEFVYHKGDIASSMWVLLEGTVSLSMDELSTLAGYRMIGEFGLLTRQDRGEDCKTATACRLLRLSSAGLDHLIRHDADVMWKLCRPSLQAIMDTLKTVRLPFRNMLLLSGDYLFCTGEESEELFILVNGRIRITNGKKRQQRQAFEYDVVQKGETIGQRSLLSGTKHTKNAMAVRDSELIAIDRRCFDRMLQQNPEHIYSIFRTYHERNEVQASGETSSFLNCEKNLIAIASTDMKLRVDVFAERLILALEELGHSVRLITGEMIRTRFNSITRSEDMLFNRSISYYLHQAEDHYDYVVALADNDCDSVWTRWILKQVDLIYLVGYADEDPQETTLESEVQLHRRNGTYNAEKHLVLIHPANAVRPSGTREWLRPRRSIDKHFHIKINRDSDYARLARIASGCAVGLVLGGGGAKGMAHLGALQALMEAGVPIDYIGTCSIGSQVGALLAQELSISEACARFQDFYVERYYRAIFWDLTLPALAVMTGRAFGKRLCKLVGGDDVQIEDLWLPYFAVSTDLTTRKAHIHKDGPLWLAARASSSLPILFPPVVMKDGSVLMDGGFVENCPVDSVKKVWGANLVVAIDVGSRDVIPQMPYEDSVSGWRVLLERLVLRKSEEYTSMTELLFFLTTLVDEQARDQRSKRADMLVAPTLDGFGRLEWAPDRQRQLIQLGYTTALNALQKLKRSKPRAFNDIAGKVKYAKRLRQPYVYRTKNQWRRLSLALSAILILIAARRYRKQLGVLGGKLWSALGGSLLAGREMAWRTWKRWSTGAMMTPLM